MDAWDLSSEAPAKILPGVWDVMTALAAKEAGANRLFLSGGALAAAYSLPDLGLISQDTLIETARSIVRATKLPLMVDAETGGGFMPTLAMQVERLIEVGVTAVLLEDQKFTGQSVLPVNPGLCSPEEMVARIRMAKRVGGEKFKILARTDLPVADWPFSDSLERLRRYLDAGADWVMPVRMRSMEEVEQTIKLAGRRSMTINAEGHNGFMLSHAEAARAGFSAYIVARQHMNVLAAMIDTYGTTLKGDLEGLARGFADRGTIARMMDFQRHFANVAPPGK